VPLPPPHHAGLTAEVFVLRGDRILTLVRGAGLGEGFSYVPGGIVEPGEDPLDAAVRETKEESGLDVRDARILRVWAYPTADGWETVHATYVAWSDEGDVVLSHEHTGFEWTTIDAYIARWCNEELEAAVPDFAVFLRNVRRNCELVRAHLT
jgi:8-oxo-dGTP pyrophosphatase MutT (NUDIX family)